ncbi:aminotransferase [Pelagibaculum spongiae]|uniref:Glutamate-pyruvate aminotransferase AlaA n=2 Tax=Pelagibaculum spongiae TaxID=2080658 RepID=A0A2V1GUU1_9GAMM|nr:pyridoxal phosphate-dependent aminotransferase [Pelagibaculum spongiae]PVZ62953.1 aminotransferase [Pelagibaculum spongiae]
MFEYRQSDKLSDVCYDIRGPVMTEAQRMEDEGTRILKLNIGNPAPFGFDAPDEIIKDVIRNLPHAQGYCESKGIFAARKAVMQYYQQKGVQDADLDNIWLGNGVSELILVAVQALLNNGDEVLLPAPDYPLWTAAVSLAGGKPVHYRCDEAANWYPDIQDIESKITDKTKALVVINPNNPTGSVYPKAVLQQLQEVARKHNLIVFADEIYDKILYDGAVHHSMAALADDLLTVTFNGLSKAYRAAGFRSGWMMVTGPRHKAKSYLEGLSTLTSMRLCANVPAMFAIQTALGGYQSVNDLVLPMGRLYEQREIAWEMINSIPGLSCTKPDGALYLFPRMDNRFAVSDDRQMVLDLLREQQILLVEGTAFNWPEPDHFRVVFLPRKEDLNEAMGKIGNFFENYRQA